MICQGIYPYRSNSWRIFSHWIEKRISPPHPIQPVTGDTHSFSCVCRGGRTELEEEVFAAKIKTLSLVHPFRSFAAIFISIFSLSFFNFSVWPVLRGKGGWGQDKWIIIASCSGLPHSVLFWKKKNSSCRPSSKHWVNVTPLSDDVEVFQQFLL
jgi:hypothetical protein